MLALDLRSNVIDGMTPFSHAPSPAAGGKLPAVPPEENERAFRAFVKVTDPELKYTLMDVWKGVRAIGKPFILSADEDMAKLSFENQRGFHVATSTKRFHRPKKTGKSPSATIILGGFKDEFDDPEDQLIPCDKARIIDCCYFGMGVDEAELALYFIDQLSQLPKRKRSTAHNRQYRPPEESNT